MSKIAEQKALEEYPDPQKEGFEYFDDFDFFEYLDESVASSSTRKQSRLDFIKGYDQAMQDFLKKACEWWSTIPDDTYGFNPCKIYVEHFKNYMQDAI